VGALSPTRIAAQQLFEPLRVEFDPTGRRLVLQCDPEVSVPEDQAAALLSIARLAIGNAMRHAYPEGSDGKVWVRLQGRGRLRLSIFDMGVGLPQLDGRPHPGLDAIEAFAQDLGGFARVDNRNYGGAEVAVVFPER
jgi:nitrate/nitrite-specific signal transduction histidine kinase